MTDKCPFLGRDFWKNRILTARAAERHGDWKWLSECVFGAAKKVARHVKLHFFGMCVR